MTQITMEVPEELAERLQPMGPWLPTILELGLVGFKTRATELAAEVIEFLSVNPSQEEICDFHASGRSQMRLRRLLSLNEAGLLGREEELELEELQRVEHIVTLLKARTAQQLKKGD
ncbi:MAG: hypothetical protein QF473_24430 [Planctomycetota bacterium]|jgi:hypothetical protein|nr:hypothetical protein [Planctomycetota bacterium]